MGADRTLRAPEPSRGARLIPWEQIERYGPLNPGNARLRSLFADTLDLGVWRLLWVAPSLPYYQLAEPFDRPELQAFTKRLIFSSWGLVPKAIAALTSYEAERRIMTQGRKRRINTPEARDRIKPRLRFSQARGRLTGMPAFALVYPSPALAALGDPLKFFRQQDKTNSPTQNDVLEWASGRIRRAISPLAEASPTEGSVDERWYWIAPLLLDLEDDAGRTLRWLRRPGVVEVWAGKAAGSRDEHTGFLDHILHAEQTALAVRDGSAELGKAPDDLVAVLAMLALAGPGVCALRALARIISEDDALNRESTRDGAARVAWGLRSLFNLPEAMAVAEWRRRGPFWQRTLDYCLAGCLQAVLDEYTHVLVESLGLTDRPPEETVGRVAEVTHDALALRTTSYLAHDLNLRPGGELFAAKHIRGRFALRFGADKADQEGTANRASAVRSAFNSPFWPFVLATTSVGQEGLDFHLYCHAVVHWNLPANPVDLEQREGRVHRYKGHAIRKNIATAFSRTLTNHHGRDPWKAMFDHGTASRDPNENDLVPSWIFPGDDQGARIERHTPMIPLSREHDRLDSLKRSLAAYRLALGQPRQNDLVSYLNNTLNPEQLQQTTETLRINLQPPQAKTDNQPAS